MAFSRRKIDVDYNSVGCCQISANIFRTSLRKLWPIQAFMGHPSRRTTFWNTIGPADCGEHRKAAGTVAQVMVIHKERLRQKSRRTRAGPRSIIQYGEQLSMPSSVILPFVLFLLIAIVVLYAMYRAGTWVASADSAEWGAADCGEYREAAEAIAQV